jgi:hypothetical protein
MLLVVIGVCEVAFWVVLAAGLVARYLLRSARVSTVLLVGVPLVDVVLLVATAIDLHGGATATATDGLAAAYLGFSLAFGHSMVRWADQRFAYWFAGGPPPWRPAKAGPDRVRWEWREWGKALSAVAIASGLLLAGITWVGDPERTAALLTSIGRLALVAGIWFVVGPLWTTIFRKPLV